MLGKGIDMRIIGKFYQCIDVTEYRAGAFVYQLERREWEGDNAHALYVFLGDDEETDISLFRKGPEARKRCLRFIEQHMAGNL